MSDLLSQLADFHFLRPYWLLMLLAIPVIYIGFKNYHQENSAWARAIDRHLLGYLLEQNDTVTRQTALYLVIFAALLTALSLAGPAWKKIPVPMHKAEDGLVILMDLSLSMQAADIKPSRLVKARHKLIDILDARHQGQTALIVYAGDAHIVSPLTDDTATIKAMVPALSPLIMPAMGSRPELAFELAQQMLKNSLIEKGRILLITDGLSSQDSTKIGDLLTNTQHALSILSVGSLEGAPIPIPNQGFLKQRGEIVIAKNDPATLAELVNITGARAIGLQIDDTDINYLLAENPLVLANSTREVEREFDQWREEGPWLLFLLVPIVGLAFRRGWLLSIVLLMAIQPTPSYAFSWQDLWETRDQQGAKAFSEGDHQTAAELFESSEWQASANYKAGNYEAAAQSFGSTNTATGHYNKGNALAKSGKLEQALAAYEKALEVAPDLDDAKFNRALVKQLLEQQQQQQQQKNDQQNEQQDSQSDRQNQSEQDKENSTEQNNQQKENSSDSSSQQQQSSSNEQSEKDEKQQEQQEKQGAEEQSEEQKNQQASDEKNDNQQEQESEQSQQQQPAPEESDKDTSEAQSLAEAAEQSAEQSEEQQAREQWLRRVPDDPSGLLKRKFDYQYRQRQLDNQFLPHKEDQTIW